MAERMDLTVRGRTGLNFWGRSVDEEFLPALRGRKGVKVYTEMKENEPVIGASLFVINMLIRGAEWTVKPPEASEDEELDERGQFLQECMGDMEHSWDDFIDEALTMLPYGWAWHERLYKVRRGEETNDPWYRSKYNDGRIGLRSLPLRGQETLDEWDLELDTGKVHGLWQTRATLASLGSERPYIPAEKAIHFRTSKIKNNPEGRSLLRSAYRPWYFKKHIEMFEGIGVERDLAGYPVLQVPPEIMMDNPPPEYASIRADLESALQEIKRDEREGLLIPNEESGYKFDLVSTGGQRQFDTGSIVERKSREILFCTVSDFIIVGHEQVGSFALNVSKMGMFTTAVNAFLENIEQTLEEQLTRPLLQVNGFDTSDPPRITAGRISVRDVQTKIEGVSKMAQANLLPYKPVVELTNTLLRDLDLPELSEDDFEEPTGYPGAELPGMPRGPFRGSAGRLPGSEEEA